MKLITFQPNILLNQITAYNEIQSDCFSDYSDCIIENIGIAHAVGYSPIWCVPLYNNIETVYNLIRCSPSYPQCAIIFEKDFNSIDFINYTKYSECARRSNYEENVDFSVCIDKNNEEYIKNHLIYFEATVPNITKDEIIDIINISDEDDVDIISSKLVDFALSDNIKNIIDLQYEISKPEDDSNEDITTAYKALLWHKLVNYSHITDDTIKFSFEQFKKFCLQLK